MPLHGKIVVMKRNGGDGTEFPLTASCLFGRMPDCDIRIQLPQVSREHCRIDLNENKEVILTNLSSANPTLVNGEALQQSERLKHGDVITVIDRSFRFEYPPAPTPKKRSSRGGKTETLKVLQDQQVGDTSIVETRENNLSEVSIGPHLKDGANHDNIQRSLEKTVEMESKEDGNLLQSKTSSPFNDLYQMIKKSLDVKTPRKSSASLLQTPSSRFCTPKPGSVRKNDGRPIIFTEEKSTPKKNEAKVSTGAVHKSSGTPESVKKQRKHVQLPSTEMSGPRAEEATKVKATSPRKRNSASPKQFSVCEVIEQVSAKTPKSQTRRKSKEATPITPAVTQEEKEQLTTSPKTENLRKPSPRNSGKAEKAKEASKKRKSGELGADLPSPKIKRKRVSFGGHLSPELFDKRMPPNSPLRKGATPRRSFSLLKPKQSVIRRASVIGLLKECEQDRPNVQSPEIKRSPSLKKSSSAKSASPKTPTPGEKLPKSRSPSPKAASPTKKSPKSRSSSPKSTSPAVKAPKFKSPAPKMASPGKKSPKSRSPSPKTASPGEKSSKSKSPSPARGKSPARNKVETPKAQCSTTTPGQVAYKETPTGKRRSSLGVSGAASQENAPMIGVTPSKTPKSRVQTPTVQGRFSVSRISTPSPITEDNAVTDQAPLLTVTPKIPLRRKSMKSTSRKSSSITRSAVKVMQRRSGFLQASMKMSNSWANIVKFGKKKSQVVATKKQITKKTKKKAMSKPQTPARKLKGHVSTGHADSPLTIVVGRAYKQKVVQPTGAAPRVITNTMLSRKNMKMDEDLTGISEMFKTPVNERKKSATKTPKTPTGGLGTSVVEPSVLNTPEGPDEMMVSPLSVASTIKDRRYNSEAVQRLLNGDQESSFISDIPALEIHSEFSEEQHTDLKTTAATTPKQKPEQQECLTGVKRIMKTPRPKAEAIEDLRGKILKTPKQKTEQKECLTGVKRIMKTPRTKAEPLEDIRGKLLTTPKQKPEQQECLSGVKRIYETPKHEAELLEDLQEEHLNTPKALEAGDEDLLETPAHMQESEDQKGKMSDKKSSQVVCLAGIKRIMKTPKEKSAPVEDMVGVKRLMKTPREKNEPVEENFGIKRLMKSPRLRGNAPVEDFEGLQELMEEPLTDPTGELEPNKDEDEMPVNCGVDIAKELDFAHREPQDEPSDVTDNVPKVDEAKEDDTNQVVVDDHLEVPSGHSNNESSDAMEALSQEAADENVVLQQPKLDAVVENLPEVQTEEETAAGKVTEMDAASNAPGHEKKSTRGRRAKTAEAQAAQDKQEAAEPSEGPVIPAPVRGRRGKKAEATAPPAVRQATRGKNAKATESRDVEITMEESVPQPSEVSLKRKRGRNAKKASDGQAEMVQEVVTETEMAPEPKSEQSLPADVEHEANESAAPSQKAVSKPKRGRKAKQPEQSVPEQQDGPCMHPEVPQADMARDENEDCSDQLVVLPGGTDGNKPETDSLHGVKTGTEKVTEIKEAAVQKKSVRGRRAKLVEPAQVEDKQEAAEHPEEPVVPAPVRGRRGKTTEATAPPAVGQRKRTRNAKSQESASDQAPVETQRMTEISTEAVSAQASLLNTSQENDSAPPTDEAATKPLRGRRTKQTPAESAQPEPEENEAASGEHLLANTQPQQPVVPAGGKPRRGRKTKPGTVEPNGVAEDTSVTVEAMQQSQAPVRAKRGRNAKQEEEKLDRNDETASLETTKSQEPVKKLKRTRKPEQDLVEPREEVQTIEIAVPEKAEVPLAEPVRSEKATVAAKPRRGRKAKQDAESLTPGESTEVQEVPISSTDKPKRGRRGKQAAEEVGATAEDVEHEQEAEEKKTAEPVARVVKTAKARGAKTSVKNEISQAVPAKRARRGIALTSEETHAESTALVSESASASVEPAKRGRRAAAKPTTDEAKVASDQAEDLSNAGVKKTKRSVVWKSDVEVFDIPKATPVKAVRGRKSKPGDEADTKSKKDANKTEEENLSDDVVAAQPVKRARRGSKVDVSAEKSEPARKADLKKGVEAEPQPKTRRGRSVKK